MLTRSKEGRTLFIKTVQPYHPASVSISAARGSKDSSEDDPRDVISSFLSFILSLVFHYLFIVLYRIFTALLISFFPFYILCDAADKLR